MKTVELTDYEYAILQRAIAFLDDDENIGENLRCTDEQWEELRDKFDAGPS